MQLIQFNLYGDEMARTIWLNPKHVQSVFQPQVSICRTLIFMADGTQHSVTMEAAGTCYRLMGENT